MSIVTNAWMAAACHEAGHAVAGLALGRKLMHVVVYPRGGTVPKTSDGCTRFCDDLKADWRKDIVIALAGRAAYAFLDPSSRFSRDEKGHSVDQDDVNLAHNRLFEKFPDVGDKRRERRFMVWDCFVDKLVAAPSNWRAIVAVAEALRDNGWRLDGAAATDIARTARNAS